MKCLICNSESFLKELKDVKSTKLCINNHYTHLCSIHLVRVVGIGNNKLNECSCKNLKKFEDLA